MKHLFKQHGVEHSGYCESEQHVDADDSEGRCVPYGDHGLKRNAHDTNDASFANGDSCDDYDNDASKLSWRVGQGQGQRADSCSYHVVCLSRPLHNFDIEVYVEEGNLLH